MASHRFIRERKNAWQRLEDLLKMLDRMSLRRLHREEVRELGRLYRRTASDLAIARAESRDPRLVNYLNSLVIRAHGRIYRAAAMDGGQRVRRFFFHDFPRTFRRTWRYPALAFAVFLIFALLCFVGTWHDPEFSELAGIDPFFREFTVKARVHWWESLNEANQVGAGFLMSHNLKVIFYTFACGAILGFGTLFYIALFGAHVGAILALTYRAGFGHELTTFMAGHGVLELSAVFIAGGAGMLFGSAVLFPGDLSRLDALQLRGREAIQLVVGCIPMLVVAGIIEGFISPALIPRSVKIGVALLTFITLGIYLLLSGRDQTASSKRPAPKSITSK